MPVVAGDEGNGWWRDLGRTREVCLKMGYGLRNWVCHLPVCYDRAKYLEIIDRHDEEALNAYLKKIRGNIF